MMLSYTKLTTTTIYSSNGSSSSDSSSIGGDSSSGKNPAHRERRVGLHKKWACLNIGAGSRRPHSD